MGSDVRRQDVLIGLAFAIGLLLLVVPDAFTHGSTTFWLIANSCVDAVLFTAVFVFLKIEVRKRRAANVQLTAANRLKSEFLQMAAHDLRNPLNAISLAASEIPPEKDAAFDPGESIRSSTNEMLGMIEGLLDAAALESGTLKLNRTVTDLGDCVREVVERNRLQAEHKNQRLLFSTREAYPAEVDRGRIKQAVDNLVSNAIKFSPRGEPIVVTVRREGDKIRIEVVDRGPGLTEADKKRLFGRFERLSARPTGGEASTGLGLANARQLVKLHGGEIGAESGDSSQGSRFWIELPAAK